MSDLVPIESTADKIHLIRGHKVMLDSDLAEEDTFFLFFFAEHGVLTGLGLKKSTICRIMVFMKSKKSTKK